MATKIGPTSILESLPKQIEVFGENYILNRKKNENIVLFSPECPHAGGEVEISNDGSLVCPRHNWEFDSNTGEAKIADDSLSAWDVEIREGYLYADIPKSGSKIDFDISTDNPDKPEIELLSHATLSIDHNGFKLLTDPWLCGEAFLDSWTQYPPPTCDIGDVTSDTDAIWITHEHPDHLHPKTLEQFSEDIPIYVPEPYFRRLSTRLEPLGFNNIYGLPTRTAYRLTDGIEVVCFKSSKSNDSILVINCGGFKIINCNDAGINWDVNRMIPEGDLIATKFAYGASNYPLTWNHLSIENKKEILQNRNKEQLRKCQQLCDMFDAEYILPFAAFFELIQPDHEPYRELLQINRPTDVVEYCEDVTVLDLLPGESWNGTTDMIERREDRERLFEEEFKKAYLQERLNSMSPVVTEPFNIKHDEISTYFKSLENCRRVKKIDDVALTISLTADGRTLNALIHFSEGEISYEKLDEQIPLGSADASNHVSMSTCGKRFQHIIRNNLSWDDLRIGYWCKLDRHPNEFNRHLWLLLHEPWEKHYKNRRAPNDYDIKTQLQDTSIAHLIEQEEEGVQEILSEYGLHCIGCPKGVRENIIDAAQIHGLSPHQAQELIREIEATVSIE